jgi:uncharacterized protein with PIN domain
VRLSDIGTSFHSGEVSAPSVATCAVRVYAELNEYLPSGLRYNTFLHTRLPGATVADIVNDLGLPSDIIDLILVNGASTDLSQGVNDGDRLSLYPVFESFDITSVTKLRPKPLRTIRFVLDVHLGKLAYYLRMLGFDTVYRNDFDDEDLLHIAVAEGRTLLSKDRELLTDERVQRCYRVREKHPRQQLVEVLNRFDLFGCCAPLQRCIRCNVILEPVEKRKVLDLLPPRVADVYQEFQHCAACDRVYWKGSHYERMMEFIDGIFAGR